MTTSADAINDRLRRMRAAAAGPAARAGTTAMGHLAIAATQVMLSKHSHPPGTPTTSPPGDPPAVVTGQLRRSVTATPPVSVGRYRYITTVGATVVYARIQEFGGTITPVTAPWLHWVDSVGHHVAHRVTLPARPYLRPTVVALRESGQIAKVSSAAFWRVVKSAG